MTQDTKRKRARWLLGETVKKGGKMLAVKIHPRLALGEEREPGVHFDFGGLGERGPKERGTR